MADEKIVDQLGDTSNFVKKNLKDRDEWTQLVPFMIILIHMLQQHFHKSILYRNKKLLECIYISIYTIVDSIKISQTKHL